MADLALVVFILPLLAAAVVGLFGPRLPGQGDRVAIGAIALSFLLSLGVLADVLGGGAAAGTVTWAIFGDARLVVGYQVDALSAVMLAVVTFVALMVQVYSLGYMHGDVRYKRYYATLSLFTFSMLGLVLADNLLLLFIFWELVGLCSYLLIGHWFEERENVLAANKAFLTTRVGDVGMFIGIMLLFAHTGTFHFGELGALAGAGAIPAGVLTAGALLLFAGAVGKSAQFPLHVWLPDAMAGPTPVSALIHAATMVAAGVYLVARAFGLFAASPEALAAVAWVGAFTALFAATMGLVAADIKKVLAYSTVSQLGFMVAALGMGGYTAAIFHLFTHAFFKALLFLASGSVIHATGTQDMHRMGGLFRKLPVTGWTWLVGAAALAGIPPLAGFWSKDEILLEAFHENTTLFWVLGAAAVMTAFYITRASCLTFFGRPREEEVYEHAHESPPSMSRPLILLAVLAALAGLVNSPLTGYAFADIIFFGSPHHPEPESMVLWVATLSWLIGVGLALPVYLWGIVSHERLRRLLHPLYVLLQRRYYMDDLYAAVFVRGTVGLALLVAWVDRTVVDGIVNGVGSGARRLAAYVGEFDLSVIDGAVNGVAAAVVAGGRVFRRLQTGYVQSYVLVLFLGLVAGLVILVRGG